MWEVSTQSDPKTSLLTNVIIVWVGGYLDGFTFFGHGRVFANAMTANVVLFANDLLAHPTHPDLRHLLPLGVFVLGVWAARAFRHEAVADKIRHANVVILCIEILVFLILASFSSQVPSLAITLPIVFVASLQLRTFATVGSHSYSSTFTTGNLVSLSEALFEWSFAKRDVHTRMKCRIFSCICLAFLAGAASGSIAVRHLGNAALLLAALALAIAAARLRNDPPAPRGRAGQGEPESRV